MSQQADEFHALTRDISMIARSNQTVAEASRGAIEAARTTQAGLDTTTQSVNGILVNAVSDIKSMATNASEITGVLNSVSSQIKEIHSFSEAIQSLPRRPSCLRSMPASWPPTPAKPAAVLPLSPRRSSNWPTRPAMSRATCWSGLQALHSSSTSCKTERG
jgi:hypothetical protein